jgi:hypothetical protein
MHQDGRPELLQRPKQAVLLLHLPNIWLAAAKPVHQFIVAYHHDRIELPTEPMNCPPELQEIEPEISCAPTARAGLLDFICEAGTWDRASFLQPGSSRRIAKKEEKDGSIIRATRLRWTRSMSANTLGRPDSRYRAATMIAPICNANSFAALFIQGNLTVNVLPLPGSDWMSSVAP